MEANVQTNNKLQLIEQAYDILRDPIKRDVYETANLTKLGTFLVLTETSSITISCIGYEQNGSIILHTYESLKLPRKHCEKTQRHL